MTHIVPWSVGFVFGFLILLLSLVIVGSGEGTPVPVWFVSGGLSWWLASGTRSGAIALLLVPLWWGTWIWLSCRRFGLVGKLSFAVVYIVLQIVVPWIVAARKTDCWRYFVDALRGNLSVIHVCLFLVVCAHIGVMVCLAFFGRIRSRPATDEIGSGHETYNLL